MKKYYLIGFIFLVSSLALGYFSYAGETQPKPLEAEKSEEKESTNISFVAPGVIEPISEEIEVGSEIPGKLKEVKVSEGDEVLKGQTIAILENKDFVAAVDRAETRINTLQKQRATAIARIAIAKADRNRIANGERREKRVEAKRSFEETLPAIKQAQNEVKRRERLFASGDISKEELERSKESLESLEKRSLARRESFNVVNAPARADDITKADAAIRLQEAQVKEFDGLITEAKSEIRAARANLTKTIVRSPITGIVLRKRMLDGESVSPESSTGIITVADTSELRIRVDVDESDVAKVVDGQRVYATADAFGDKRFTGKVIRIGSIMGRKNFDTEEPREKVDTKILEVLVKLQEGQELPLGLRVDAYFLKGAK